jgi:hypothetical protein
MCVFMNIYAQVGVYLSAGIARSDYAYLVRLVLLFTLRCLKGAKCVAYISPF